MDLPCLPKQSTERRVNIGDRFERLIVIAAAQIRANCLRFWPCRCDCGNEMVVYQGHLKDGHTQSCGCLKREKAAASLYVHGGRGTPEYSVWKGIRQRTVNQKPFYVGYANYSGRGIKLCDRWLAFENFLADMGKRPSKRHSVERRDNDGHYGPDNCYWATAEVQARNKRTTRWIVIGGQKKSMAEWAALYGISYKLFFVRLNCGWEPLKALTVPVFKNSHASIRIRDEGPIISCL